MIEKKELWTPKWRKFKTVKVKDLAPRWRRDEQNPEWDAYEVDYAKLAVLGIKKHRSGEIRLIVADRRKKSAKQVGDDSG